MKKLLSAVTSFVMGASLMTSAFASSVSAAGSVSAVQPNVSIGEVNNVPANRSAAVSNGDIVLDFGTYENVKAGDKVTVEVKLKSGADNAVGSYDVKFKLDSPLTIAAFGGSSAAYGNATVEKNTETLQASFICLENGDPVKGTQDENVFKFSVQVPEGTADGIYTVGLASAEIYKGGKNSDMWTYSVEGGTIKVGNPSPDTSTTTTTVTTTSTTTTAPADKDIVLDFGNYTAAKGEKVTVNVVLAKGGSNDVGSYDVKFKLDSPLTITAFGGSSAAYGNATVEKNAETLQASFICLENGDPIKGTEGENVFKFSVQVPEDCADGVYNVGLASAEIYKGGKNSDMWTYAAINGNITVGNPDPGSSTTTTTTTTSSVVNDGEIVFDFGNHEAVAGEKVTVEVLLKNGADLPLTSMDVKFKLDSPLTISAFGASSPAYGGASVESNKETLQASFMCMDEKADPIKGTAGETVFKFSVQIPEGTADGTYKVGIASAEIFKHGENSDTWPFSVVNGNIKVGSTTTTTTSADTTTTTTTTTTVTTTVTTTISTSIASTTSNVIIPVEGSVEWVIPTVNAKPGETVTMNVLVKNSDLEVAGAQYIIKAASPIVYDSVSGSDAYKSDIEKNDKTQEFAFGEKIGDGVKAANDSKVMVLTYKVPADCADGTYPVTWNNAFISDTNGADITSKVKLTDGAIVVKNDVADGEIEWVLDNVKAKPGETVTLKAVVSDPKASELPVAGAQFIIKADSPIVYSSIAGTDAYKASFEANNATQEFAFAHENGEQIAAANGATVLTLTYKVPADCKAGVYDVKWSDAFISDKTAIPSLLTLSSLTVLSQLSTTNMVQLSGSFPRRKLSPAIQLLWKLL